MKRWLPWIIILLFIALSVRSALSESLTFDEVVDQQEGLSALIHHTFTVDPNHPPFIRELAMAPIALGLTVPSNVPAVRALPARMVIIALSALLLIVVYRTSLGLFGQSGALVALFLLAFEPTFFANSHYTTFDAGVTVFVFLAYAATVRYLKTRLFRDGLLTTILIALACASKELAVPFLFISIFLLFLTVKKNNRPSVKTLGISGLIIFLVIWATYFFRLAVLIPAGGANARVSAKLATLAASHHIPLLANGLRLAETVPLPLGNYFIIFKNALVRSAQPSQYFFFGNFYSAHRWYFMPVTFFFKEPLSLWILFGVGVTVWLRKRKQITGIWLIPIAVITIFSLFMGLPPLVRHFLPAIPFLALLAGSAVAWSNTNVRRIVLAILLLSYAWSFASSYPHTLAYANFIAGPADMRFTKFTDSNLDWGQTLPDIALYIRQTKPAQVKLSYFGRDSGVGYGLASSLAYGSYKIEDICAFHIIDLPYQGRAVTLISVSNWYYCGYKNLPQYRQNQIYDLIRGTTLVFYERNN